MFIYHIQMEQETTIHPAGKKRCPKGTRKNKKGDCVPVKENEIVSSHSGSESSPSDKPNTENKKRPKCPKGTRKNKKGDCVPIQPAEIDAKSVSPAPAPVSTQLMDDDEMLFRPEDLDDKDVLEELEKQLTAPVQPPRKRCPKGQRRDKDGNCIPILVQQPPVQPLLPTQSPNPTRATTIATQPKKSIPKSKEMQKSVVRLDNEDDGIQYDNIKNYNQYLRYKEYTQYKNASINPEFLYPHLDDPSFNIKIAQRAEFHDTQYDGTVHNIENRANELCNAKFELSPHQLFVKNFLSFQTPYNSLLLYHSLGTGKTCSAIGIAEEMRSFMKQAGIKSKILFVASPNLQGNFRKQLFDESGLKQIINPSNPDEYTWNIESCVGNTFIQEMNPNQMAKNIPRERIVSNINTIINHYYEFMGYGQLANYITDVIKVDTNSNYTEKQIRNIEVTNIKNAFNNRLIIIDEVHNIRLTDDNNNKTVASLLMKVAKYSDNMKLLLLSATPMFNSHEEIIWLTNLMNLNDKRSTIEMRDVFDTKGQFKSTSTKKIESGDDLLIRKLTGYVSYVRGENPYVFPFRIYPKSFDKPHTLSSFSYPKTQMNGKSVDEPIKHIDVFLNQVSPFTYQMKAYHFLMEQLKQRSFDVYDSEGDLLRTMPSFEDMDAFGYALLQIPLEALNMVYPNQIFDKAYQKMSDLDLGQYKELIHGCVGEKGLSKVMRYTELTTPVPMKKDFEYYPEVLEKYERVFSPQRIGLYSHKIKTLCDIIVKSKGIIIVYSQYIDGGIIPACLALEEMGFTRKAINENVPLFKTPPTEAIDSLTMEPRSSYSGTNFKQASYIIISGDKGYSPNNKQSMQLITSPTNIDGSEVKVVFISKAGSEGLDFKNVRQIHIMEPWYNMNRIEQIIGRGVRNLSHCALPFKQRNVQIFMHATLFEGQDVEPADLYVYRLAEKKALKIGRVTRLLKETAVDCILNIGQTNFTTTTLEKVEENKNVLMELSSGSTIQFRVGDQPFTDICDYMDNCELQCRPMEKITRESLIVDTYNREFAHTNLQYISQRIRQLFREKFVYHRDTLIRAITANKTFPIEQIFMALSNFVDNKYNYVIDMYGRFGTILNVDVYYVFQPIELSDTQISMFERSVPVDYRRNALLLEVPTETPPLYEPGTITAPPLTVTDKNAIMETEPVSDTVAVEKEPVLSSRSIKTIMEDLNARIKDTQTPQNIKKSMDWYKHFYYAREHMNTIYDFSDEVLTQNAVYHYLDTLPYVDKITVLKGLNDDTIEYGGPLMKNSIHGYFEKGIMYNRPQNIMGTFIAHGEMAELWIKPINGDKWTLSASNEHELFVNDITSMYAVHRENITQIVGFIGNFRNKEMVFKVKDLGQKRNNIGANVASATKADVIKLMNFILGEERYTVENTENITKVSLCCVLECVVRNKTTSQKVYFLNAERAILRDIVHM